MSCPSRWSLVTLLVPMSALVPRTWLAGSWSTTHCTGCPSMESWPTPGWLKTLPRSPPPCPLSPANELLICFNTPRCFMDSVGQKCSIQAVQGCKTCTPIIWGWCLISFDLCIHCGLLPFSLIWIFVCWHLELLCCLSAFVNIFVVQFVCKYFIVSFSNYESLMSWL